MLSSAWDGLLGNQSLRKKFNFSDRKRKLKGERTKTTMNVPTVHTKTKILAEEPPN